LSSNFNQRYCNGLSNVEESEEGMGDSPVDLNPFFNPKSVVVVGASSNPFKPGGRPLRALQEAGFEGEIYLVNPNYTQIEDRTCYPTVQEVPADVLDLAIIVVSAEYVKEAVKQCAEKGVKGSLVFTSGFSEVGGEASEVEKEIAELARNHGMRLMGPNSLGMINNLNGLWASFARMQKYQDHTFTHRFSLISQSGFFGAFIFQLAGQMKLGFDYFASVGNQADLSFTDFFEHMVHDPYTKIIAGYIEGLKDGQGVRFMNLARDARSQDKPVIVMKTGRTGVGASAASSHTGSLAGEDHVYDTAFQQSGVIRADGLEQLLALLNVSATGRWPKGKRTAIVSASGGGAVILADKCGQLGLEVVDFAPETREALDEILPFFASSANPVDLTAQVLTDRELLYQSLRIVEKDPNVDVLLISFQLGLDLFEPISQQLVEVYEQIEKPMVLVGYPFGDPGEVFELLCQMREAGIPVIDSNHNGVWSVKALADWVESREDVLHIEDNSEKSASKLADDERSFCADLIASASRRNMTEYQAGKILKTYGIKIPRGEVVSSVDETLKAAHKIGFPVTLKVQSPDVTHKSDIDGVKLNLSNEEEVKEAVTSIWARMKEENLFSTLEGILVQETLRPATEVILGMKRDEVFGPVIMFGLGGVFVEVMEDISFRVAPLSRRDAWSMIQEIRGFKILQGMRGAPPADIEALVDTILKLSQLAVDHERLVEIDINPLFVYPEGEGVIAADALFTLE